MNSFLVLASSLVRRRYKDTAKMISLEASIKLLRFLGMVLIGLGVSLSLGIPSPNEDWSQHEVREGII